jgi:hypothetical protein
MNVPANPKEKLTLRRGRREDSPRKRSVCHHLVVTTLSQNGHRAVSHNGAWQGFTMSIARYVDERLTVIVMTNLDENNAKPEKIAQDVAAIYLK